MFKTLLLAGTISVALTGVASACDFENQTPLKSLSAGFEAWKIVTSFMEKCGNLEAELDQEYRTKQPAAFAADPSLYQIGGVANDTLVPLQNAGTVRSLDALVEKYGHTLTPNQLIKINGETMAIAMMVNAQHLMYREDILNDLGIPVPKTYEDVLAAAATIKDAGVVDHPLGGTLKTGWNIGQEFVNMYLGMGGTFFADDNMPAIENQQGIDALEMLKKLTEFMDPEYLVSDPTYVQQQFQQGKIAMATLWASRAAAMDDPKESQVVGKVKMAGAPTAGVRAASTLWWDGFVIAKNTSDENAEAAFRVALNGLTPEVLAAHNDAAVWLIDGYEAGPLAIGVVQTVDAGAVPYPASSQMGLMHTALGNGIVDYLTGKKDAKTTLNDVAGAYVTSAREAGLIK